jgi:protein-disulfide isomerase
MSQQRRDRADRLRAERAQAAAAQRRRERLIRIGAAVAMVVVVVAIGVAVQLNRSRTDPNAVRPQGVTQVGGGIPVGPAAAGAPVIDIYEDFQCPVCKAFEGESGSVLTELEKSGQAQLVYHPMSFIGPESDRAANAAGCAADEGKFKELHDTLFANQPDGENTGAWTNEALIALGQRAGISGAGFAPCVRDGRYNDWTQQVDQESSQHGVTGTPTIFVNGAQLPQDALTPSGLRAAVADATSPK